MTQLRGRLFAFAFITAYRKFLGLPLSQWLRIGLYLMLVGCLVIGLWWTAGFIWLLLVMRWAVYRWAKRNGYATFTEERHPPDPADIPLLPGHKKIPTQATGTFSAGDHEHDVLLRPANIWHIPIDEHAIMVDRAPGLYLYQFLEPGHVRKIRLGYFWFGGEEMPGLEITFDTAWSPQISHHAIAYYIGGGQDTVQRLERRIYLAFNTAEECRLVWKSIAHRPPEE